MQIGSYSLGIGGILAILVIIFAVLGLVGVLPFSASVIFALIVVLAVARLT